MEIKPLAIPGCFEIQPKVFHDQRGQFVKVFHEALFASNGLNTKFSEEYYSHSKKGVVRGMHFQSPPHDHVKVVYCVSGEVLDVVVDLRKGSPTYQQAVTLHLSAEKANMIYIPRGMAHGFCALSEMATLVYKVETVHNAAHDAGVLWNSVDVSWPVSEPVVSERDRSFVGLSNFQSPFVF